MAASNFRTSSSSNGRKTTNFGSKYRKKIDTNDKERKPRCLPIWIVPFAVLLVLVVWMQLVLNLVSHVSWQASNDISPSLSMNNNNNLRGHEDTQAAGNAATVSRLQDENKKMRSQIATLESNSQSYVDDPRFFPFLIRDSRHLTPVQPDPNFQVFDYVDLSKAMQTKSNDSRLWHNARIIGDDPPCQAYSVECYKQKILQVFSYILTNFPSVEYYFYTEADTNLCVPMTKVQELALAEQRYFVNLGIGASGWIMSREFMGDFIRLYNASEIPNPDIVASYYLVERQAWAVSRQYWVSHTTHESIGAASLTVLDQRNKETGKRQRLTKHLPRCLEPRRAKWKIRQEEPFLDPRDRFGWDYFDYDVCPDDLFFPCGGPEQLKKLVADDWRVANESGALAKWKEQGNNTNPGCIQPDC